MPGLDYSWYYQIRDVHVDHDQFTPFMSPQGAAFMTRWWNQMPQYDGLFDFQDRVRPSYFAFKLLSCLTGNRLKLESSNQAVHGFATHDKTYQIDQVLLWNFSGTQAKVELVLEELPRNMLVCPLTLDALAASDDANARLRPQPRARMNQGTHRLSVELGPHEVKFRSFE